jgi:hypothetical protein
MCHAGLYAKRKPQPTSLVARNQILSTQRIGRAMLSVASRGYPKRILETKDIRAAADAEAGK